MSVRSHSKYQKGTSARTCRQPGMERELPDPVERQAPVPSVRRVLASMYAGFYSVRIADVRCLTSYYYFMAR